MNAIDFKVGVALAHADIPFDALICAALIRADSRNAEKLRMSFPKLCADAQARYDAPGGILAARL